MDIKQLRAFLAVANSRSFLKAADELFVSRQAVSKTILQLEDELNIDLFSRNQSGAMMTPAGIFFYPRAQALVSDFDKLIRDMREIEYSYRPKLHLYLALGLYGCYADRLRTYAEEHRAEMDIRLTGVPDADCNTALMDRQASMVISFTKQESNAAVNEQIAETPVRLLIAENHPLVGTGEEALRSLPMLLYTGGWETCPWWHEEIRPRDVLSADLDYLFRLVRRGEGIMPLPEMMIPEYRVGTVLPAFPGVRNCKIWRTTLLPNYYDALTYNLLALVQKDVFSGKE